MLLQVSLRRRKRTFWNKWSRSGKPHCPAGQNNSVRALTKTQGPTVETIKLFTGPHPSLVQQLAGKKGQSDASKPVNKRKKGSRMSQLQAALHELFSHIPQTAPISTPHLVHGSLGSQEFHLERHSDRFIRFCRVRQSAQRTQTTQRATSAAIGRVSAMNAMRPLITSRPIQPPQSNLVIQLNVSK